MGLMISIVISYAGINEATECVKHILNGVVPNTQPDFQDLVDYYTRRLRELNNQSSNNWINECQGYLCLSEDDNGKLRSAAVRYYNSQADSTAILFSTKISSFGQESLEDYSIGNGDCRSERYSPIKTKTNVSNTPESFNVDYRDKSPVPKDISNHLEERKETEDKLTWLYNPQSPTQEPPEIHFQSFDDKAGVYNEDFLRSLDGIKYRPLQRNDPSGRRRSFKKRNSSSSTSSRDSRASREEELKMFTSLEEAEFERMNKTGNSGVFGSAPNLSARSYSRSRSRERKADNWSVEASVDNVADVDDQKQEPKDVPKLKSFEEETNENTEVIEEEEEIDFWGTMGD